jgi:SAM-dependent methyltransferase
MRDSVQSTASQLGTYARLKAGQRWLWSLGDYDEMARRLQPYADALAEACRIAPGTHVLDVGAGTGNLAVEAARRGAVVVASDLSPRMVELGRARSAAEHLAIEWHEADAEDLPFEDGRFDVVASAFGAMFAPRPELVAKELARLARPGGLVAMANYCPDGGFVSAFATLLERFSPPPPLPLPSHFAWGDPDEVRRRLGGLTGSIGIERRTGSFTFDSTEDALAFWRRTNPAVIALERLLPAERHEELLHEAARLLGDLHEPEDGRMVVRFDYLEVLARTRPSRPMSSAGST